MLARMHHHRHQASGAVFVTMEQAAEEARVRMNSRAGAGAAGSGLRSGQHLRDAGALYADGGDGSTTTARQMTAAAAGARAKL